MWCWVVIAAGINAIEVIGGPQRHHALPHTTGLHRAIFIHSFIIDLDYRWPSQLVKTLPALRLSR